MADLKACDVHDKEHPHNLIDTDKTEVVRIYVERKQTVAGKPVTTNLFAGNSQNEGVDVCLKCFNEWFLRRMEPVTRPSWKVIEWTQTTKTKKDGSGTYQSNEKRVYSLDEIKSRVEASPPIAK